MKFNTNRCFPCVASYWNHFRCTEENTANRKGNNGRFSFISRPCRKISYQPDPTRADLGGIHCNPPSHHVHLLSVRFNKGIFVQDTVPLTITQNLTTSQQGFELNTVQFCVDFSFCYIITQFTPSR